VSLVEQDRDEHSRDPAAHRCTLSRDSKCGLDGFERADEHDVLGLGNELELGEGADLARVDAGLALERERLEGPLLGDPGALDAPGECGFLIRLPLRAEQARDELLVGEVGLLGAFGFLVEQLGDLA